MEKRWNLLNTNPLLVSQLHEVLRVNTVICSILANRGIERFEEAKDFFRPSLLSLHSPWLMKDMTLATDRILTAFSRREKILVYGDYDVDGTTAVACFYDFLRQVYEPALIEFYIPNRYREGYGVSLAGVDFAAKNNFTLIVSLDCGIKSTDIIGYAKTLGVDFIVCDHHLPDQELPPAAAILNPKQPGCTYPFKELCGCGVGYKLITALAEKLQLPNETPYQYLDLVATAIAADIVPVTGENRVLAYFGLKKVNSNPNAGIRALIQLSKLTKEIHINNLVFMIAPRVNAAGRMDDARKAVQMFIATSHEEAMQFAEMLHADNTDRREADDNITEEALAIIEQEVFVEGRTTTVVFQPHWHKGVVGIVASRLIERHYRPTIVLTKSGDYVAGSARSVSGFNLYEAIHACRDHLLGYGGHFAAAGLTLLPENLDAFKLKFEEIVSSTIEKRLLIPEIVVDAEAGFADLTVPFYNVLCQMEPFGPGNLRPVFISRQVVDTGYSKIVKELHVKFSLRQGHLTMSGIGFNLADKFSLLAQKKPVDILYTLDENEWNGQKSLQLKIIDLKASA